MDPLYMANEGKMIIIVPEPVSGLVLNELRKNEKGVNAAIIGEVLETPVNKVFIKTITGGSRIIDMLVGDQLPRIC
jgi:hydrogenase expression/formation protein HypE